MKNMAAVAIPLVLSMLLSACGGGGSSDTASPEGAGSPPAVSGSATPAPMATATPALPGATTPATPPDPAPGWTAGADFVVNTTPADGQVVPAVARLQGGGHVVVWTAAAGDAVTLRRYDLHGMPTGTESVLDAGRAGVHPTVVALPDGGFAVGWFQFPGFVPGSGQDSGMQQVMVQRFDSSGTPTMAPTLAGMSWGVRFMGTDPTRAVPRPPMLAPLAGGGLVVVWPGAADAGSPAQMNATLFDIHGAPGGQTTLSLPVGTTVAPLSDGGFLTAGFDTRFTGGAPIVAQRYDAKAQPVGAPLALGGNTRTASPLWVSSFMMKDGSPALLHASVDPIGGPTQQVHYGLISLSATDGSLLHSWAIGDRLVSGFASAQLQGAALDDGGFVVMSSLWKPGVQLPETHVLLQRFDASGQATVQASFESVLVAGSPQPVYVPAAIAGAVDDTVLVVTRAPDGQGAINVVALHR